ncbi:hypothetical protein OHA21_51315 [Actinoplanes sp. NBC_00393]|uniref:hypothetical protein n=1 Tax=Actinoplanes sp. NBC_00393 TaxID=2975953 RepID=UPI002E1FC639
MPIDTRLDGDPGQLYSTARWLRDDLAFEVNASASALRSAGADAAENWRGAAGATFYGRMSGAAAKADALHGEIQQTAGAFTGYADRLASAQGRMARARDVAVAGGLDVTGEVINDPGPAPNAAGPVPNAAGPAPDAAAYARKVQAYNLAQTEAEGARAEMAAGTEVARSAQSSARARPVLQQNDVLHGGSSAILQEEPGPNGNRPSPSLPEEGRGRLNDPAGAAPPPNASKPSDPGSEGAAAPPNGSKPSDPGSEGAAAPPPSPSKPVEGTGSASGEARGSLSENGGPGTSPPPNASKPSEPDTGSASGEARGELDRNGGAEAQPPNGSKPSEPDTGSASGEARGELDRNGDVEAQPPNGSKPAEESGSAAGEARGERAERDAGGPNGESGSDGRLRNQDGAETPSKPTAEEGRGRLNG